MNNYESALSHLIGTNPDSKKLKRIVGVVVILAMTFTPLAFSHALLGYAKREANQIVKWEVQPILKSISENSYLQRVNNNNK